VQIHIQTSAQAVTISSFDMDGIAGLAFSGLSTITNPTLLDLLAAQHPEVYKTIKYYSPHHNVDALHYDLGPEILFHVSIHISCK
jgi:hypothetical protein